MIFPNKNSTVEVFNLYLSPKREMDGAHATVSKTFTLYTRYTSLQVAG